MLVKQVHQKSAIFVTIGISEINVLNFNQMSAILMSALLMMSMNLSDIAILNIKDFDYGCIISRISKSEAINIMENTGLTGKSRTL